MTVEQIASVCHEANRAYCLSIGDSSQTAWKDAPEWQRTSAINGVAFHINNPNASPSIIHDSWLKEKIDSGWRYGPVKDAVKKEHPCCVPYNELSEEQKAKDSLFIGVVRALKTLLPPSRSAVHG